MEESKNTVVNKVKRKEFGYVTPFQCYHNNSLTKEKKPQYHLPSTYKRTNRSVLDYHEDDSERGQLCLKHSLGLNWVCFTCGFGVFCSQCLAQSHKSRTKSQMGNKLSQSITPKKQPTLTSPPSLTKQPPLISQHDIRPLQRSFAFMKNSLIQCQIRLDAKCNILTNMNQQIHSLKIELYNEKSEYRQELQRQFEYIYSVLRQKEEQMVGELEGMFDQHERRYIEMIDQIKVLQEYYDQCQNSISHILQLPSPTQHHTQLHTCLFYSQHSHTLSSILSDHQIDSIKQQIYSINFKLQNHDLNHILSYIHQLQLGCEQKFAYKNILNQSISNVNKEIHKVKSQTQLKTSNKVGKKQPVVFTHLQPLIKNSSIKSMHPLSRNQKQRQSHKVNPIFATYTPKALSKQTKIELLKKSPQNNLLKKRKKSNAKIVSMPASPAKEDKQERSSPVNIARGFIIEGMKKKTTIVKKKK